MEDLKWRIFYTPDEVIEVDYCAGSFVFRVVHKSSYEKWQHLVDCVEIADGGALAAWDEVEV